MPESSSKAASDLKLFILTNHSCQQKQKLGHWSRLGRGKAAAIGGVLTALPQRCCGLSKAAISFCFPWLWKIVEECLCWSMQEENCNTGKSLVVFHV